MNALLLWSSLLSIVQTPPDIDANQFARLVEAQVGPLRDVSFLYEGSLRWIGPKSVWANQPGRERAKNPGLYGESFQGAYLYRRNDAALRDTYYKNHADPSFVKRVKVASLRGQAKDLTIYGNAKPRPGLEQPAKEVGGGMRALSGLGSPHTFFRLARLLNMGGSQESGFQAIAWEQVEGHRCLKFRLDISGASREEGTYEEYWLDLERGANLARVDYYEKGKLGTRLDKVLLSRQKLGDGTSIWVPVRTRVQEFQWNGVEYTSPVVEMMFEVIDGTILVNQGLPDGVFDLDREMALPAAGELQRIRQAESELSIAKEYESLPPEPPLRLDPAGVRERLEQSLKKAEEQSRMLEASAPSREPWTWVGATQIVAILAAIGLVGGAWAIRRRGG